MYLSYWYWTCCTSIHIVAPIAISEFFPSRIRIKEFEYGILTQKLFLSSQKYDPGCSSRIRILIFSIPDPGVKKAPDPGSGSATLFKCTGSNRIHIGLLW
jgi:hypothetical protein